MKAEQITPGLVYAIAANKVEGYGYSTSRGSRRYGMRASGTTDQVVEGVVAAPAKIVAVGKFRWKQSGLCAWEIVDDHFTTSVHAQVPDLEKMFKGDRQKAHDFANGGEKRIGLSQGVKVTDKSIVWKDVILPLSAVVMPWAMFVIRHGEVLFAQQEAQAYYARLEEIRKEIYKLAEAHASAENGAEPTKVTSSSELSNSRGKFVRERNLPNVDQLIVKVTTTYSIKGIPGVAELLKEAAGIEEKLSCAR